MAPRQLLRFGTVKWPVTRPPLWPTPGAPPSITARPVSRSITSREPLTCDPLAVELDVADQGDQLAVRGRRCRNCRARSPTGCGRPLRRWRRAAGSGSRRRSNKRPSAASVSSVSSAWRTWTLPAKIARSARSWTSIRSAATSTGALLSCPFSAEAAPCGWARPAAAGEREPPRRSGWLQPAHGHHLTAPCTIFKRAPPSSTTLRSSRSAAELAGAERAELHRPVDRAGARAWCALRGRPSRRASRAGSRRARRPAPGRRSRPSAGRGRSGRGWRAIITGPCASPSRASIPSMSTTGTSELCWTAEWATISNFWPLLSWPT